MGKKEKLDSSNENIDWEKWNEWYREALEKKYPYNFNRKPETMNEDFKWTDALVAEYSLQSELNIPQFKQSKLKQPLFTKGQVIGIIEKILTLNK